MIIKNHKSWIHSCVFSLFLAVTVTLCASKRWSWPEMTRAEAGWHRKEGVSVGWVSVRWCLPSWPAAATSSSTASASKTSRCGTNTHNPSPQPPHGNQPDLQPEQFCMLRSFPGKIWLRARLWFARRFALTSVGGVVGSVSEMSRLFWLAGDLGVFREEGSNLHKGHAHISPLEGRQ